MEGKEGGYRGPRWWRQRKECTSARPHTRKHRRRADARVAKAVGAMVRVQPRSPCSPGHTGLRDTRLEDRHALLPYSYPYPQPKPDNNIFMISQLLTRLQLGTSAHNISVRPHYELVNAVVTPVSDPCIRNIE